jgi:DNA-binding winged helix-turn-helix (wHTH) protein
MSGTYRFGRFALDADAGMLLHGGEPALLGQRAVALLRLLLLWRNGCRRRSVSAGTRHFKHR